MKKTTVLFSSLFLIALSAGGQDQAPEKQWKAEAPPPNSKFSAVYVAGGCRVSVFICHYGVEVVAQGAADSAGNTLSQRITIWKCWQGECSEHVTSRKSGDGAPEQIGKITWYVDRASGSKTPDTEAGRNVFLEQCGGVLPSLPEEVKQDFLGYWKQEMHYSLPHVAPRSIR